MIRVVLCDDSPDLRVLFRLELEAEGDIEVVAVGADGHEAIDLVRQHRPDVVVLDLAMPKASGMHVIPRIKSDVPQARILVVTGTADQVLKLRSIEVGASACLDKRTGAAGLRVAVRSLGPRSS